ncbi:MAG: recombinase family protein, partial [Desulfobacterales bacterium]|nr:recombinase family protein [Desulfobacterales bacterium]
MTAKPQTENLKTRRQVQQFVALARVSSREQEREGFSLEIQEDALERYASQNNGKIVKLYRIAETASKTAERTTFKELLAYVRKNAHRLDGVLFFKVDRAARNLFDYVEVERLEAEHGVPAIYVSQPTENTPAGRMMRRTLANMATFYTEQQSLDIREGQRRRVESGLFVGKAPYGYVNVRRDGRSVVEIDPIKATKVKRIFDLYAYHRHTLDSLRVQLRDEGITYLDSKPQFARSKLHLILTDRAYIGEVPFQGQWLSGTQEPIVDRETFNRVQTLLGNKRYQSHELTYAGSLIRCGHCGSFITGEKRIKKTKSGEKEYHYYRCSRYNSEGHPRIRLTEAALDQQVMDLFKRIRIQDKEVREWFRDVIRTTTQDDQRITKRQLEDLNRQLTAVRHQQDQLLNLRIMEEIDADTYAAKHTELRDRAADLTLQIEACDRTNDEMGETALRVFELSQSLADKWIEADVIEKRRILEIVGSDYLLDGVTLCYSIKRPFDVLAEGSFLKNGRGDWIRTS